MTSPQHNSSSPHALVAALALLALAPAAPAWADVVETTDGSMIHGELLASDEGTIKIKTEFAGTIEIKQAQVKSLTTDAAIMVALASGETMRGRIEQSDAGLRVTGPAGTMQAQPATIAALWREGDKSPAERRAEALQRRWTYQLALDLNGKRGNSERSFYGFSGRAEMKTDDDRLFFYGSYARAEDSGVTSQDEGRGGIDYTNHFTPKLSWYVRSESGFDGTKDLDLRSQSGAGLGFSLLNEPKHTLEARVGLSYRFEDYGAAQDFDSAGLDLGILHSAELRFARLNNSLTITPSFDDFANYAITHESTLEMPLAGSVDWKLRVGVKNDYNSKPPAGLEKHDWSYLSQLVFTWQ